MIDPIRTRPHVYREAKAIEEESKWEKVNFERGKPRDLR